MSIAVLGHTETAKKALQFIATQTTTVATEIAVSRIPELGHLGGVAHLFDHVHWVEQQLIERESELMVL